jgi:putative ABC transport system permease protein
MLTNFFRVAFRNLWRNKVTSLIHVLGLALGIATFLLIVLFVQRELSFDRFNKKADRIVRVVFRGKMNGGEIKEANVMPPVAAALKADFPEVLDAVRLQNTGVHRITYGDKTFREDNMAFADSNFFRLFTLPLLEFPCWRAIRTLPFSNLTPSSSQRQSRKSILAMPTLSGRCCSSRTTALPLP